MTKLPTSSTSGIKSLAVPRNSLRAQGERITAQTMAEHIRRMSGEPERKQLKIGDEPLEDILAKLSEWKRELGGRIEIRVQINSE